MVRERGLGDRGNFFSPTSTFMFLLRFSFPHLPHIAYHDVYSHTFFQMCAQWLRLLQSPLSLSLSLSPLFRYFSTSLYSFSSGFHQQRRKLECVGRKRGEREGGRGRSRSPPPPDIPTPPNPDLMRSSWPSPRRSRSLSSSWICRWWVRAKKNTSEFFFWQIFDIWVFRPRIELLTSSFIFWFVPTVHW